MRPNRRHRGGKPEMVQLAAGLHRTGCREEALAAYMRAASARPQDVGVHGRIAATLAELGRHSEAVAAWQKVTQLCPGDANGAVGLGLSLLAAGRMTDALAWLCGACERHPRHAGLLRLQARALLALGLRAQAIGALYLALDLEPDAASTHAGLAIALFQQHAAVAALPHALEAVQREPSAANAATLSCILIDLGRHAEALAVTGLDVLDASASVELMLNRSIALEALGRKQEALAAARGALAAGPDKSAAQHHLAATLLASGHLTPEAWALYEGRAGLSGAPTWPDPARRWRGEDVAGKTLLLHAEQGLGDTLQFVRYAPVIARLGARVILAVQPPLVRLLQGTPGADLVVPVGPDLPEYDLYCPLLSLPGLVGTSLDTIPPPLAYALPLPPRLPSDTLRVGLVWAGSGGFADDRKRSIDPAAMSPLLTVPGARFYSLQVGGGPMPQGVVDLMQQVGDFAATAQLVAGLDLVIAVDTAVAHLAGTLGVPVWLLSRFRGCWRWLQEREDTPWYPTMRIFRQCVPDDWPGVLRRVRQELEALTCADQDVGRFSCSPERLQWATSSPR